MQGKGLVQFFLFFMLAICGYQLLLLIPTRNTESNAVAYADKVSKAMPAGAMKDFEHKKAENAYLDSVSDQTVLNLGLVKYTYSQLKKQQLALGLDLKGGMSVVLQVDLSDLISTLASNPADPQFVTALNNAKKAQTTANQDFVTLFADEFKKVAPTRTLASLFVGNTALSKSINVETSDAAVIDFIRKSGNETVNLTYTRLKERIDKFGVTQPNVSLDSRTDRIIIELPGVDNPERARSYLQASAKLEFWDVWRMGEIGQQVNAANETLKRNPTLTTDSTGKVVPVPEDTAKAKSTAGPLFKILQPAGEPSFATVGTARGADTAKVNKYLARADIRALFPLNCKFVWAKNPEKDRKTGVISHNYELYALRTQLGKADAPLTGDHVTEAHSNTSQKTGGFEVDLTMDNEGARIWRDMTREAAAANNRQVAIVLDNEVVSAPTVQGEIGEGNTSITGSFGATEAQDLANILQVGKLPARTQIIEENVVGPTLGKDNINSSLWSIFMGLLFTMLFMVAYYSTAGVVAIVALIVNFIFIIGACASLGTVLTVPGIAGMLLTISMAVDANIVIYERIREELRHGKGTVQAIRDGFMHSYAPIIDSHVTALITSLILFYFGLGPIKGFGAILTIGVFCTLFASILISRLIMEWWTGRGGELKYSTPISARLFENANIDFVGMRRWTYIFSAVFSTVALISMFTRGFDFGVDFKGGYSYTVSLNKTPDLDKLRTALTFDKQEPIVKTVNTQNTVEITTSYKVESPDPKTDGEVKAKVEAALNDLGFTNPKFESSKKVGPLVADDIKRSSFITAFLAISLIFLYILVRFRKWQYSLGATVALIHDVIHTLGWFSLFWGIFPFSMQIDQALIAAILTIIGYSMNDTVIVFDRIREYLHDHPERPLKTNINAAINNTLNRTVVTSGVTLMTVLILFIFGGSVIKGFAFALVVGMIIGTYSSIFIATPIVVDFTRDREPAPVKEATPAVAEVTA